MDTVRGTPTARHLLPILALAGALSPAPAARGAEPVQADYSRTPILFVHGYFVVDDAGDATWANFRKRAVAEGWPEEYLRTPSFRDVRGCNEDHVAEIDAWVEELRARTYSDRVDVVCHSFGCLNTLTWLKERCGVNRVRQFVGLAGAVHGTVVACADDLLGLSCAGHEMCIPPGEGGWSDNALLAAVNACDETPGDVGYTAVWSTYDEIIRPPEGCRMAGARNIEVATDWVEHGGIFLCDECWDHVREALRGAGGGNEDGPGWGCLAPECRPPAVADPPPEAAPETGEAVPEVAPEPIPEGEARAEAVEAPPEPAAEPAPEPVPDGRPARDDGMDDDDGGGGGPRDAAGDDGAGPTVPPGAKGSGCAAGAAGDRGPGAALPAAALMAALLVPGRRRAPPAAPRRP